MFWRTLVLLLVGSAFGVGFGVLGAGIGRWNYVPVLIPVVMGAAVGVAIGMTGHMLRLRSRAAVGLVVGLSWLVTVTTFHYVEYRYQFVPSMSELSTLEGGPPLVTDAERLEVADKVLHSAVGRTGFEGFITLRARSGIRFRLGTTLPNWWAGVLMWSLDILIGLLVVGRLAFGITRRIPAEAVAPSGAGVVVSEATPPL